MKMKSLPLAKVYRLIEPGPVVLLTTAHGRRENVMTLSWHTNMEFEPPLIGCIVSNRHFSFDLLKASRECVIAIPTVELAAKTVKVGNLTGRRIDKFKKFKLGKMPASVVKAPLIPECYANLECKVVDGAWINKYNFFVLEVKRAWIDRDRKHPRMIHHLGMGRFTVDGRTIKISSKMK